jgi:ribulose-5-phosphate 4-epimerase/fuculose-1-phosphate aldolase
LGGARADCGILTEEDIIGRTSAVNEDALRADLVRACKVLYEIGAVGRGLAGHLSARLDAERLLVKPRPTSWVSLTEDDIIVVDFEGKRLDGPNDDALEILEWPIHSQVYRARPDVSAVLHGHPVDSTILGALGIKIEPITRETAALAGKVVTYSSVLAARLIDTIQLGNETAQHLGDNSVVLVKYHGTVIAERSIGDICLTAGNLEIAAQTMLKVAAARPVPVLSPAQYAELLENQFPTTLDSKRAPERWRLLQSYHRS